MNTSQISTLSKPCGANRIEPWELAYFQARNRSRAHAVVLKEFQESGLTQADLARRLGKRPEVISRLLGAPGNWGLDTMSDLLFAIRGGEAAWGVDYPLNENDRNYRRPDWLDPIQQTSTDDFLDPSINRSISTTTAESQLRWTFTATN